LAYGRGLLWVGNTADGFYFQLNLMLSLQGFFYLLTDPVACFEWIFRVKVFAQLRDKGIPISIFLGQILRSSLSPMSCAPGYQDPSGHVERHALRLVLQPLKVFVPSHYDTF
jgi:hypothetical protein